MTGSVVTHQRLVDKVCDGAFLKSTLLLHPIPLRCILVRPLRWMHLWLSLRLRRVRSRMHLRLRDGAGRVGRLRAASRKLRAHE